MEVKAGQTTSLTQTELIKVSAQIHQSGNNRRQISADYQTSQGLGITDAKVDNKRPEAPKYEIHDSDGELIASGNLE